MLVVFILHGFINFSSWSNPKLNIFIANSSTSCKLSIYSTVENFNFINFISRRASSELIELSCVKKIRFAQVSSVAVSSNIPSLLDPLEGRFTAVLIVLFLESVDKR